MLTVGSVIDFFFDANTEYFSTTVPATTSTEELQDHQALFDPRSQTQASSHAQVATPTEDPAPTEDPPPATGSDSSGHDDYRRTLPTVVSALSIAVAVLLPGWTIINAAQAFIRAKRRQAAASSTVLGLVTLQTWAPTKVIRYISVSLPFVISASVLVLPFVEGEPAHAERIISSIATCIRCGIGLAFSIAGKVNTRDKWEHRYQYLKSTVDVISFGCYAAAYAQEIDAVDYKQNDTECIGLGLAGIVMHFIGNMASLVIFIQYERHSIAGMQGALIALGVSAATKLSSGVLQTVRFEHQIEQKFVPTLMRS